MIDFSINILAGIFILVLDFFVSYRRSSIDIIKAYTLYHNKYIRVSFSYLFKIQCHDKYLLIKGNRLPNQFQPIGGTYKYYKQYTKTLFSKWEILDDSMMPLDEECKDDLRLRIKGKHLYKFINWFDQKIDRETSPTREFQEEMVKTGILSEHNFKYIMYNFLKIKKFPLRYSKFAQGPELIVADIFELLLTQEQENELQILYSTPNIRLMWATEEQIKNLGIENKKNLEAIISPTAEWIINA